MLFAHRRSVLASASRLARSPGRARRATMQRSLWQPGPKYNDTVPACAFPFLGLGALKTGLARGHATSPFLDSVTFAAHLLQQAHCVLKGGAMRGGSTRFTPGPDRDPTGSSPLSRSRSERSAHKSSESRNPQPYRSKATNRYRGSNSLSTPSTYARESTTGTYRRRLARATPSSHPNRGHTARFRRNSLGILYTPLRSDEMPANMASSWPPEP